MRPAGGKHIRCGAMMMIAVFLLLVDAHAGSDAPKEKQRIQIIAHRGANCVAPENTYAAAQRCIEWGVDYLEVDVQPSKDGVLYNLHDLWLNRTTNGRGLLLSKYSADIDQLDAGSWFDPKFSGERIPRYDQFLPWLKGKIKVNFDIRAVDLPKLIELVRANHMEQDCFFYFVSSPMALRFHELAPDLAIKMNVSSPPEAEQAATNYHARLVEIPFALLTNELLETCRRHQLEVIVCAAENTREEYLKILDSPVDMVMLDRPDLFLELQKDRK
ncbi:MAG TPA: glycerophosphodiester phosphodiesterase family protein [Candidatus Hydrogenedentes bacterium]|nr:glycerophosphodiester phosphodiesterase family protein [Candidatus Hydrogenedentota bacterium]